MYSIADLAEMTGMTDRTLRNYLNAGFLHGEKIDGRWQFTPEQFAEFLQNENLRPALEAKRNSWVFDFLADPQTPGACVMLDLAGGPSQEISNFFCEAANNHEGMHMSYHAGSGRARVILTGTERDVLDVLAAYREKFS